MNTPAHIAVSIFVWRHEPGWRGACAVTFGAILPDAPMFGFYAYQKFTGSSERLIWSTLYFEEHWQTFFDVFNSIPIALACLLVAVACRRPLAVILLASVLLHLVCDLPLHHDDAHRHFWPHPWRYQSPFSY